MQGISAVIITFNEEKRIGSCLSSLQGIADEIIVMDSFSTDQTENICRQYGVKFLRQSWQGYGFQKNKAAGQASNDYILSLDADECLSDTLKQSILAEKKTGLSGVYMFSRLNNFYGKDLHHGNSYPDYAKRLYNKTMVKWSERPVHETLEIPAGNAVKKLKGDLLHRTKESIEDHLSFINKYSTLSARAYLENGKKASVFKLLVNPAFAFIKGYFFRFGFLDGYAGLIFAVISSHEVFLKYSKLLLLQKKQFKKSLFIFIRNKERPEEFRHYLRKK
ncbi:MAG: glycosyltransferase family 2 protein [Bacteroidota bacterium]